MERYVLFLDVEYEGETMLGIFETEEEAKQDFLNDYCREDDTYEIYEEYGATIIEVVGTILSGRIERWTV